MELVSAMDAAIRLKRSLGHGGVLPVDYEGMWTEETEDMSSMLFNMGGHGCGPGRHQHTSHRSTLVNRFGVALVS